MRHVTLMFIVMILVAVFLAMDTSSAEIITVDDDGGEDYTNIQHAIDNSSNGDVIRVMEGTYPGRLIVNKTITISGADRNITVIDGEGYRRAVGIYNQSVLIHNITIMNCGASEDDAGVHITADSVSLLNCTILNCTNGIYLYDCENATILNNIMDRGGITFSEFNSINEFSNHTIEENFVNGRRIIYINENRFYSWSDLQGGGQYILANVSGIMLLSVSSGNSTLSNVSASIVLAYSDYCMISGADIHNVSLGIYLIYSDYCNIASVSINNTNYGIRLRSSRGCTFSNLSITGAESIGISYFPHTIIGSSSNRLYDSRITDCQVGVAFSLLCHYNVVSNVLFESNMNGIQIVSSSLNQIVGCTIRENTNTGILLSASYNEIKGCTIEKNLFGIGLDTSSDHNSVNSSIIRENYHGIQLQQASNNEILRCRIIDNSVGIYATDSSEDNIANNCDIVDNNQYGVQVEDNGLLNDIDAQNCWWGSDSGPYHYLWNRNGEGNEVTSNVDYDPWLDQPFDNPIPIAIIDRIHNSPSQVGDNVEFTATGTDDGAVVGYSWRSSIDGLLYEGNYTKFNTRGLNSGIHTIYLKVRDNMGAWSNEVETFLHISKPPEAFFDSVSANPAYYMQTIELEAHGTGEAPIVEYKWRSSIDGQFYLGPDPLFNFGQLSVGEHIISVKVRDENGFWSEEATATISVYNRPVAAINTISPNPATKGEVVYFMINASVVDSNTTLYVWHSSIDGEFSNSSDPLCSSPSLSVGQHLITLQVQGEHGLWSREVSSSLVVNEIPPEDDGDDDNDDEGSNLMRYLMFAIVGFFLIGIVYVARERHLTRDLELYGDPEDWSDEENDTGIGETEGLAKAIAPASAAQFMPPQEFKVSPPTPPPQQEQSNVCPDCHSELKFIPPLKKWYCNNCKEFVCHLRSMPQHQLISVFHASMHFFPHQIHPVRAFAKFRKHSQGLAVYRHLLCFSSLHCCS